MTFNDTSLNPYVQYALHALSIDEAREPFKRVEWTPGTDKTHDGHEPLLKQIWFAGNHADIGGSYSENESRLSDSALLWMVKEATSVSVPIFVDPRFLNLYPAHDAPQHDECKVGVPIFAGLATYKWERLDRPIKLDAPLHAAAKLRFEVKAVLDHDVTKPYRPRMLREHRDVYHYYAADDLILTHGSQAYNQAQKKLAKAKAADDTEQQEYWERVSGEIERRARDQG
jgi:hypothetical protein